MSDNQVTSLPITKAQLTYFAKQLGKAIAQANNQSGVVQPYSVISIDGIAVTLPDWLANASLAEDVDGHFQDARLRAFVAIFRAVKSYSPSGYRATEPRQLPDQPNFIALAP
jgi:hypothetical protein